MGGGEGRGKVLPRVGLGGRWRAWPTRSVCQGIIQKLSGSHSPMNAAYSSMISRYAALRAPPRASAPAAPAGSRGERAHGHEQHDQQLRHTTL